MYSVITRPGVSGVEISTLFFLFLVASRGDAHASLRVRNNDETS